MKLTLKPSVFEFLKAESDATKIPFHEIINKTLAEKYNLDPEMIYNDTYEQEVKELVKKGY